MQCLPEVPKLPAKGTHDTFRNPFKTVAIRECRFVLHPAVVVPDSRRLLFQVSICQKASQPHYPRGHGFVERQVQTVKKTILKCRETKEDIDLALLALRTTPLSSNIPSPAELLNGRTLKSTLPRKIHPPRNQEDFRNWLKTRQDNQSQYYNRYTKELPELHKDQAIYVQDPVRKTWNPAKVISQGDTPRSYIVETETGAQLRRNRIHLMTKQFNH